MSEIIALVDYDNVRRNKSEKTIADVEINLTAIAGEVVKVAKLYAAKDVSFRLYGGWIDQRGHYSHRAQWLLTLLSSVRGKRLGVRVRPALVTAIASADDIALIGTVRTDRTPPAQKMVDTMMAVDAIHLSIAQRVLIVSD